MKNYKGEMQIIFFFTFNFVYCNETYHKQKQLPQSLPVDWLSKYKLSIFHCAKSMIVLLAGWLAYKNCNNKYFQNMKRTLKCYTCCKVWF